MTASFAKVSDFGPLVPQHQRNIQPSKLSPKLYGQNDHKPQKKKIEKKEVHLDDVFEDDEEDFEVVTNKIDLFGFEVNPYLLSLVPIIMIGLYYTYKRYKETGKVINMPEMSLNTNTLAIIFLSLVFVILLMQYIYPNPKKEDFIQSGKVKKSIDLRWRHKDAKKVYDRLVEKYGYPKFVDKYKGGMAVWGRNQLKDTVFVRHELLDESIVHKFPTRHRDFLYSYINYDVPPEKLLDILSLSGSITYDPLKKWLRARCGSIEANIATLALATQIGEGNVTLGYVQDNQMYKAWLKSTKSPKNVTKLYDLKGEKV